MKILLLTLSLALSGCAALQPTKVYERVWDAEKQEVVTVEETMVPRWRW